MAAARTSDARERIVTTHAGSLPKPRALTELHLARSRGEWVDDDDLERAAQAAAEEVVARQVEVGLDVVNDAPAVTRIPIAPSDAIDHVEKK